MTGNWLAAAACRHPECDPETFFPGTNDSPHAAFAWCKTCPVQTECLTAAEANPNTVGVWGGKVFGARRYNTAVCRNGHQRPAGTRCRDCQAAQRAREQQQRRRLTVTL